MKTLRFPRPLTGDFFIRSFDIKGRDGVLHQHQFLKIGAIQIIFYYICKWMREHHPRPHLGINLNKLVPLYFKDYLNNL